MKDENVTIGLGVIIGYILTLYAMIALEITPKHVNERWEKELISKGFGKYVIDTEKNIKFEWIDK